ncbi:MULTISPECIES: hypothetical protein [unclassified Bradyrhizobium]|uniref:hypothetical protein n=1 Tax=unclassified Bradyrhizobium TaxID=2631580 RepID=UPI0028EA9711|nr:MULTISPECIES: hypothetical protein [unclassified Bradyrhizobium]
MEAAAKLLTAMAAFFGAVAWPATVFALLFLFRSELRLLLRTMPAVLNKIQKASLVGINLELDKVAAETDIAGEEKGKITPRQIEAAARIKIQTPQVGSETLLQELDRLCLEYDTIRRTMPAGSDRTRAMTRLLVKMRSLAPSLIEYIDVYKGSGSAGSRLAAIAMMQMDPPAGDLNWLRDRFSSEQPFVFYHAALALQNMADILKTPHEKKRMLESVEHALAIIRKFKGVPDLRTIEVLEMILNSLQKQS